MVETNRLDEGAASVDEVKKGKIESHLHPHTYARTRKRTYEGER